MLKIIGGCVLRNHSGSHQETILGAGDTTQVGYMQASTLSAIL